MTAKLWGKVDGIKTECQRTGGTYDAKSKWREAGLKFEGSFAVEKYSIRIGVKVNEIDVKPAENVNLFYSSYPLLHKKRASDSLPSYSLPFETWTRYGINTGRVPYRFDIVKGWPGGKELEAYVMNSRGESLSFVVNTLEGKTVGTYIAFPSRIETVPPESPRPAPLMVKFDGKKFIEMLDDGRPNLAIPELDVLSLIIRYSQLISEGEKLSRRKAFPVIESESEVTEVKKFHKMALESTASALESIAADCYLKSSLTSGVMDLPTFLKK